MMRWLLFLSRVAFLCGVILILAVSLLVFNWNKDEPVSSTIITTGYGLALFMIPFINLLYLIVTLAGKKIGKVVPRWLIVFNICCLVILILYIVYLNGNFYFKR